MKRLPNWNILLATSSTKISRIWLTSASLSGTEYMVFSRKGTPDHYLSVHILRGDSIVDRVEQRNLWSTHPVFIVIPTDTSCCIE